MLVGLLLGGVSERLKEHAWKACVRYKRTVGSNPTPSANLHRIFTDFSAYSSVSFKFVHAISRKYAFVCFSGKVRLDMTTFIGRKKELDALIGLKRKATASLVVIRGRRRIGKSRLAGCQIDYLIQTRFNCLYVCEVKFRQESL